MSLREISRFLDRRLINHDLIKAKFIVLYVFFYSSLNFSYRLFRMKFVVFGYFFLIENWDEEVRIGKFSTGI